MLRSTQERTKLIDIAWKYTPASRFYSHGLARVPADPGLGQDLNAPS